MRAAEELLRLDLTDAEMASGPSRGQAGAAELLPTVRVSCTSCLHCWKAEHKALSSSLHTAQLQLSFENKGEEMLARVYVF